MEQQTTRSRILLFFLLLFVLVIFFRSVSLLSFTSKDDEFFYHTAGKMILEGQYLYKDFADIKPPLIFYTYAFLQWLGGGNTEVYYYLHKFMTAFTVFLTACGLYLLGREMRDRRAGMIAALLLAGYSICVKGAESLPGNTELYSALPAVFALYFFARRDFAPGVPALIAAGLLSSLAALYSLRTGILIAVFGLFLLYRYRLTKEFFLKSLLLGAAFALPFLVVIFYYWDRGMLDSLVTWQVYFNRYYMGGYPWWVQAIRPFLVVEFLIGLAPLLIFMVFYVKTGIRERRYGDARFVFLMLLLLLVYLSCYAGGKHSARYYYVTFLPLCAGASLGILDLWELLRSKTGDSALLRRVQAVILAFLIFSPVLHTYYHFMGSGTSKKEFMASIRPVVDYVKGNTRPDEKIFVWPFGGMIYFYSDRSMATGFFSPIGHLATGKYLDTADKAGRIWGLFLEQFRRDRPRLVIDYTDRFGSVNREMNPYVEAHRKVFLDYIDAHYRNAGRVGNVVIYKRRD